MSPLVYPQGPGEAKNCSPDLEGVGQQTDPCVLMGQIPELPAQEEGPSELEPPQDSGILRDMLLPHAMLGN